MFSPTLLSTMAGKQELPFSFRMKGGIPLSLSPGSADFRGLRGGSKPTIMTFGVYFDQPLKSADRLCRSHSGAWARAACDLVTSHLHPR